MPAGQCVRPCFEVTPTCVAGQRRAIKSVQLPEQVLQQVSRPWHAYHSPNSTTFSSSIRFGSSMASCVAVSRTIVLCGPAKSSLAPCTGQWRRAVGRKGARCIWQQFESCDDRRASARGSHRKLVGLGSSCCAGLRRGRLRSLRSQPARCHWDDTAQRRGRGNGGTSGVMQP